MALNSQTVTTSSSQEKSMVARWWRSTKVKAYVMEVAQVEGRLHGGVEPAVTHLGPGRRTRAHSITGVSEMDMKPEMRMWTP